MAELFNFLNLDSSSSVFSFCFGLFYQPDVPYLTVENDALHLVI